MSGTQGNNTGSNGNWVSAAVPLFTTQTPQNEDVNAASRGTEAETVTTVKAKSKKGGGRVGIPNYNNGDVEALLDIVAEVLPLGNNMWEGVAAQHAKWCEDNNRPLRDGTSLKNKFDKLANDKKKTGDPLCPLEVRRAKKLARDINDKAFSGSLGFNTENNGEAPTVIQGETNDSTQASADVNNAPPPGNTSILSVVGARVNKRVSGAAGRKVLSANARTSEVLAESVSAMVQSVQKMTEHVAEGRSSSVRDLVRQEVSDALAPTKTSIAELKDLVLGIANRLPQN